MAANTKGKNQKNSSITALALDPGDGQRFSIAPELLLEDSRRRKVYLLAQFRDGETNAPLTPPDAKKFASYCNASGEIAISNPLKSDMFGGMDSRITVPYELFEPLHCNRKILAVLSLHQRDNDALLSKAELMLLVNFGNKFTEYSDEKYTKYLKSVGDDEQCLAWADKLLYAEGASKDARRMGLELLMELAEKNSPQAQYQLAQVLGDETLPFHDPAGAERLLKKAAEGGSQQAQTELATRYLDNSTQTVDTDRAVVLYQKAAESGNAEAQYKLYLHYKTPGDTYDRARAFEWLEKSCIAGFEPALDELGPFYTDGYMDPDYIQQYMQILLSAAENNSAQAQFLLFNIFFEGECLGEPFQKDRKQALTWLIRSAENNSPQACYKIWHLYENGNDFLMEESAALTWLQLAAEHEHPLALSDMGELYIQGRIVEKNNDRGIELIKKSAELLNWDAQMKVYSIHASGRYHDILFDIDREAANAYLVQAAKTGNPIAQRLIWTLYLDGNPLMMVREQALECITLAAELGHTPAIYDLANIYIEGKYLDADLEMGRQLLEKAARLDEPKAQFALFRLFYYGHYSGLKSGINKERAYNWIRLAANAYEVAQHEMWKIYIASNEMDLYANEALDYLLKAAKSQYADAIFDLGVVFSKGELVPKNVENGVALIQKAAEMRYPPAIYEFSKIKVDGKYQGVKVAQDVPEGLRLLKLAAEFGYAPAQLRIWHDFNRNNEVGISERFALEYLNQAAAAGYAPAIEALALK